MLQELAETIRSHLDLQKETPNAPQSPEPCGVEDGLLSKWDGDHVFFIGGTRVGVFVKKLLDVCAQAKYTKKALKFYASLASRVWSIRVVDEWPVKS